MAIWLDQSDLSNVLSVATFNAIFADSVTGVINLGILASVIERAEQEVLSWLVDQYGPNIENQAGLGSDLFLKGCALEFGIVYAFDRYPEYARANGKEREERYKRAEERMARVLSSRQRPTSLQRQPANVGGANVDGSNRIYISNADGTSNSGDF